MRILALDISTKTGYACVSMGKNAFQLIDAGTLEKKPNLYEKVYKHPVDYAFWSNSCAIEILHLIEKWQPNHIVIEQTSKGSKNALSQKIIEFIHCRLADYFVNHDYPRTYYLTEEWRRICNCKMTDSEKKQNAEVRKQRKKGKKVCKNEDEKRIGIVGKKHVNVRRANEVYGLNLLLKDEDRADALLLAHAYYLENFKK